MYLINFSFKKQLLNPLSIFLIFSSSLFYGQYSELPGGYNEKKAAINKSNGLPEDFGLYKRFDFRIEESEEFATNFEQFKLNLKKETVIDEIFLDEKKRNVTVICTYKNSIDFLFKLKTILHQSNFRLRKYKEIVVEKNSTKY